MASTVRVSLRRLVARRVHELHCGTPPTCGAIERWARGSRPKCAGQLSGDEITAIMLAIREHPIGAKFPAKVRS